jgi:hypothetical protein
MNLISELGGLPLDTDPFLTLLYVLIDDFFQREGLPEAQRSGPRPALRRSEVLCLALFGRWGCFGGSQRAFWRYAQAHLRPYFPGLGERSRFNRLERRYGPELQRLATGLAPQLGALRARYEALDLTAAPTRNAQRRGRGWLAGQADSGFSNRLGWFAGFKVLASCTPRGVITGFGVAPASTKDQPFAESFLARRYYAAGRARLPAVGWPARGGYVVDKGFAGEPRHRAWQQAWGVAVVCAPPAYPGAKHPWPKAARRRVAHLRQSIETVFGKRLRCFGLEYERPHCLEGFLARWAARVGLHNFCIWLNRQLGRADLAFADLVDCWAT